MNLPEQALEGKITVGMFDSAVVSSPANLSPGVHLIDDKNGWVVYKDDVMLDFLQLIEKPSFLRKQESIIHLLDN